MGLITATEGKFLTQVADVADSSRVYAQSIFTNTPEAWRTADADEQAAWQERMDAAMAEDKLAGAMPSAEEGAAV